MKSGLLIFIVILVGLVLWIVRIFMGHEDRTMGRLVLTGVVAEETHVELLHSTGYKRDNIHVFRVPYSQIKIKGEAFDLKDESQKDKLAEIRKLIEPHDPAHTVDWTQAEIYEVEDKNVLALVTVVRPKGDQSFVILQVF